MHLNIFQFLKHGSKMNIKLFLEEVLKGGERHHLWKSVDQTCSRDFITQQTEIDLADRLGDKTDECIEV